MHCVRTAAPAARRPLRAPRRPLGAQTIDDGLMMPRRQLCTGFLYTHDSWDRYWEGSLERGNGNIGTLTTQSVAGWAPTASPTGST